MLNKAHIFLRAPEPQDVEFLYQLENDPQFWHLSNTTVPFSRFDLEQYILLADKDIFKAKQARFIIELEASHQKNIIGAIDLFNVESKHQRAGIGIMITEENRGFGYAGTALDILIDYSFKHLELHQLFCNVEKDNLKSLKLFKEKGFVVSGEKKEWNKRNNKWIDELFLQLIDR
ncbi:MAG: GNAT family N-acetyltransferase [Marinilabiliales bacterium]|nr:MAG: GNAT family N-acetyltransferase [Marinilabiliales bacterium]